MDATDYLVKPLDPAQVGRCMERLRSYLAAPSSISLLEPSGRGHSAPVEVALDDVLYGQYLDHVMTVYTCSGAYRTRSSFQDFTAQLPHTGRFYVCGRGLVVNLPGGTGSGQRTAVEKRGKALLQPEPEAGNPKGIRGMGR